MNPFDTPKDPLFFTVPPPTIGGVQNGLGLCGSIGSCGSSAAVGRFMPSLLLPGIKKTLQHNGHWFLLKFFLTEEAKSPKTNSPPDLVT